MHISIVGRNKNICYYLSIFKDLRIEFYIFDIKLVENFEGY